MLNDEEMIAKRKGGGHRFKKRKRIRWSLPIFNKFFTGSAVRGIMNLPPCCNRNSRTKWENSVISPPSIVFSYLYTFLAPDSLSVGNSGPQLVD